MDLVACAWQIRDKDIALFDSSVDQGYVFTDVVNK